MQNCNNVKLKTASMLPLPKEYTVSGDRFSLSLTVSVPKDAPKFLKTAASVLSEYTCRLYGQGLELCDGGAIRFNYDASLEKEEYRLDLTDGGVTVTASALPGASHGASALLQLMEISDGSITVPSCTVTDKPNVPWRGLMIDLARANYPLSDIFTYADLCYYYRLSVLHLHFADGMVYTLPSTHFPKLPEGCVHYSKEEIEEISRYLADRGIMLVPEIEMPAHAEMLVAKYPELFGSAHKELICPGHEGALDGLDVLIGEVCELFPDAPYIHVGCDEAKYSEWDTCPLCRRFMEKNKLSSSKELYTYLVDKSTRMVLKRGRTPIVWEGFPEEGTEMLSRDIVVMIFQSTYQNINSLEKAGFHVINASWQPLYIVPSRPKYFSSESIYRWNTYRWLYEDAENDGDALDAEISEAVLGAQLCVWESVTFNNDGEIVCSNLPAMAERTWNHEPRMTFEEYSSLAQAMLEKLTPSIQNRREWFNRKNV